MIDHLSTLKECAAIIRGEHSAWRGDRIENAEHYLYRVGHDMPEQAEALIDDLGANARDYSDETGLSPDRIGWAANRLREGIKSSHVTALYASRANGAHAACAPSGPFVR